MSCRIAGHFLIVLQTVYLLFGLAIQIEQDGETQCV